jgi:ornithine cyclodeaminase/alanine dehydrogenase-like protein (mu-crystallin family)
VSVLILSDENVREVLDMESCIAAMEDVLAALARDELFLPLRSIVRPPAESLFGLMPAYRGGDDPVFSLK